MNNPLSFFEDISLHVEHRISLEDATRQERTARELQRRLNSQPGVILADEVGMGKTFVALATAVSVAISDPKRRPVVIMVPPSLKQKWPTDFELFRQKCLPTKLAAKVTAAQADGAVRFFKLLDDPPSRRPHLIFLVHGAFSRQLVDKWVMLAFMRQSLHRRRDADDLRRRLPNVLSELLEMRWVGGTGSRIWAELLATPPAQWLKLLQRHSVDPEHDRDPNTDDDPVPDAVVRFLRGLTVSDTRGIFDALAAIPVRRSPTWSSRVREAARVIRAEIRKLWPRCIAALQLHLPLLVLDEAHHLKNPGTQLASLFRNEEAREDMEMIRGAFGGVFERMLLLTATPFQLGHAELCSVLSTFGGTNWQARSAPEGGRAHFDRQMAQLRSSLDAAQQAAVTLDTAWGRLRAEDLLVSGAAVPCPDEWWHAAQQTDELTDTTRDVKRCYQVTKERMRAAERLLKPWVVRHLRPRHLPGEFSHRLRRERLAGNAICNPSGPPETGITVSRQSLLPFLLAARATSCSPESRPVFAEGLASSYEAFLHTRRINRAKGNAFAGLDGDEDADVLLTDCDDTMAWYLNRLEELVPKDDAAASAAHPKIAATVQRVVDLWRAGEKVLVFCHYVATGQTLRLRISDAIDGEIRRVGAAKLGCHLTQVEAELETLGRRFFDVESPVRRGCERSARGLLADWPELVDHAEDLKEVMRRFMRTPSFLTRFFELRGRLDEDSVEAALANADGSGTTLRQLLEDFFKFLAERCGGEERRRYLDAVLHMQTGRRGGAVPGSASANNDDDAHTGRQVPNVRLVNGSTAPETRARYMLAFNTPFYPEVLVASSVLAEGVDLHLACRHVIHHDLCWNPSTLEQRTGRVDRIGAKAERCGQPIHVYLPYIAETQDEKMYRVVMDRERWFSVVMGEKYQVDARTTEKLADRVPFPEAAAQALAFRLDLG